MKKSIPVHKEPYFFTFPGLKMSCTQCNYTATTQGSLVYHLRTHPKSRQCPHCGKEFSSIQNLIKHARLHTEERPYPCPVVNCPWAYKQKGDLLSHIGRGKHCMASDNNRKPPKQKFYNNSNSVPIMKAITLEELENDSNLKEIVIKLRNKEEMQINERNNKLKRNKRLSFEYKLLLSCQSIPINLSAYQKQNYNFPNIERKTRVINRTYGENYSVILVPINSLKQTYNSNNLDRFNDIYVQPNKKRKINNDFLMKILPIVSNNNTDKNLSVRCAPSGNGFINDLVNKVKMESIKNEQNVSEVCTTVNLTRSKIRLNFNQNGAGYWICDAPQCESLFITQEKLKTHIKKCHNKGEYGCKYCLRFYRSLKNLQNHIISNHNGNPDDYLSGFQYNQFVRVAKLPNQIRSFPKGHQIHVKIKLTESSSMVSKKEEINGDQVAQDKIKTPERISKSTFNFDDFNNSQLDPLYLNTLRNNNNNNNSYNKNNNNYEYSEVDLEANRESSLDFINDGDNFLQNNYNDFENCSYFDDSRFNLMGDNFMNCSTDGNEDSSNVVSVNYGASSDTNIYSSSVCEDKQCRYGIKKCCYFNCAATENEQGKQLWYCGKCTIMRYCSKKCQIDDFPYHRQICEILEKNEKNIESIVHNCISEYL